MRGRTRPTIARMATIREQIDIDLKKAMLARNDDAKDALRMAKSDMLLKEVDLAGKPLTEADAIAILQKCIKSRKDSIEAYEAGGRPDAAAKERAEIAVLAVYLPKGMDEAETRAAIEAVKSELGLSGKGDLGKLMKELKARHANLDGRLASQLAGTILG